MNLHAMVEAEVIGLRLSSPVWIFIAVNFPVSAALAAFHKILMLYSFLFSSKYF